MPKCRAPIDEEQAEGLDITCASHASSPVAHVQQLTVSLASHHFMTLLFDDKLSLAPIGDNPQVR